ncbi:MAG: hypothetical protein IJG59_03310 [Erysipelotrichaceae bacterium]|nr:hypothetical protein [Erysipelotrichaceae bacterium]
MSFSDFINGMKNMFVSIYGVSPYMFASFIVIIIMTVIITVMLTISTVRWITKK